MTYWSTSQTTVLCSCGLKNRPLVALWYRFPVGRSLLIIIFNVIVVVYPIISIIIIINKDSKITDFKLSGEISLNILYIRRVFSDQDTVHVKLFHFSGFDIVSKSLVPIRFQSVQFLLLVWHTVFEYVQHY
jgi:hypothetical protein